MSFSLPTSNFEFNKFAFLLSKYNYQFKPNDILAGIIIGLERKHAIVDLGLKKVAFLPLKEIYLEIPSFPDQILDINFIGEFFILYYNKKTNQILVSLKQIHAIYRWERLKQMNFQTTILYAKTIQILKRGRILDFGKLKFYALNLHIPKFYRRNKNKNFLIPFKFLEIKEYIHLVQVNIKLAIFTKLSMLIQINTLFLGTIISIKDFGIFINILGLQCFLHISQISRKRSLNLRNIYKQGNQINVRILYKNFEQGKIFVTLF
uniref:30S ribosomal protein S1 n=1 Tax=Dictyotopsis propagulifera TaxID=670095 RepID=UPI002E79C228|nr:30S ribosomal protein S1 [Dictyotopsis propagulifera]WAM63252.1 30S ribosomal protein S1 [Dictyotopsis propagulifera]